MSCSTRKLTSCWLSSTSRCSFPLSLVHPCILQLTHTGSPVEDFIRLTTSSQKPEERRGSKNHLLQVMYDSMMENLPVGVTPPYTLEQVKGRISLNTHRISAVSRRPWHSLRPLCSLHCSSSHPDMPSELFTDVVGKSHSTYTFWVYSKSNFPEEERKKMIAAVVEKVRQPSSSTSSLSYSVGEGNLRGHSCLSREEWEEREETQVERL